MLPTRPGLPENLTIAAVVERLAAAEAVEGVILLGSGANNNLTPSSDWDICVVLAEWPVPLWLALTRLENRVAEFYFVLAADFEEVGRTADFSFAPQTRSGLLASWLLRGNIRFDRSGQLGALRQKLGNAPAVFQAPPNEKLYSQWFRINYNLRESERLLVSVETDSAVGTMFDLRLLVYGLADVWHGYFELRELRWQGEKAAIAHLTTYDPDFLAQINQFIAESDRKRRFALYKTLAAQATAPLGGLWPENSTAIELDFLSDWKITDLEKGLAFWEQLLGI